MRRFLTLVCLLCVAIPAGFRSPVARAIRQGIIATAKATG